MVVGELGLAMLARRCNEGSVGRRSCLARAI